MYYSESRIYAGTSAGFFSFDDNLENITNLSANLTFLDVLSMVISKNKIFIGTNGAGAYYRELDETEWKNTGDFTNINRLRHFNNLMYSCNRSGLHISNDSGLKWQIYSFIGHDVKDYYQLNDVSFVLFSEGVYRKNQKDDEWSIILRSADLESKIKFTCLTGNNDKLYLGTNMGLYSSDNLGESWIKVSKEINILNTIIDQDEIFVIASDGLYKANIQSDSFSLSKTFSSSWIKSVASHMKNVYLSNGTRLYKSSDRGITWDEITKSDVVGFYDISITENCIFVGSNYGKILLSYDNGNTWHIDSSLANEKYHTSFTYGYENYIFTSYKYQGQIKHLRRAELSSIVSGIKENSPLHQPYSIHPNPASEYIEISSPHINPTVNRRVDEGSEIKIYNTLGECVLTEPIHPMTLSHRMNVESLPRGVYYLRIGNRTQMFVKM
ncbi:MAG: T9SS type A sorting domain-containing protein [Candidatus Kapabacteria bacterium]|nr:T9SS type A sorting domain-containing protein [Candidatus Kapabacteria bacterium]